MAVVRVKWSLSNAFRAHTSMGISFRSQQHSAPSYKIENAPIANANANSSTFAHTPIPPFKEPNTPAHLPHSAHSAAGTNSGTDDQAD